jgi:hypothetical protein
MYAIWEGTNEQRDREIIRRVADFEQLYLKQFWKLQLYQWENYVEGAHHDLCAEDKEIYRLVECHKDTVHPPNRKGRVTHDIIARELVDKNPEVSQLRNQLDELFIGGVSERPKHELAHIAEPFVLDLMRIRDRLARESGYSSYVDLVLSTEEIEQDRLVAFLNQYLEKNLKAARRIAKKRQSYTPQYMSNNKDQDSHPTLPVFEFLDQMGYDKLKDTIRIIVGDWGYEGILSPDDIRILVTPTDLFHELGHAITHSLNTEVGIFKTWTGAFHESMAEIVDLIASRMLLDQIGREAARDDRVLSHTRYAISALFEFSLWESPDQAESLYTQHHRQLDERVSDPSLWPLDTFRSIDPVFIHNYVIGAVVAEQTVGFLEDNYGTDYRGWGEWLEKNYFCDGRRRSLQEKLETVGSAASRRYESAR